METNQKDRWAARAARYAESAARKRAEADRLMERQDHERDIAFLTQPGRLVARDRMWARLEKAAELAAQADRAAEKAANLQAMASRNKGDADRARAAARDSLDVQVGDTVRTLYGDRTVTKVNTKSIRVAGVSAPIDKSLAKLVARA